MTNTSTIGADMLRWHSTTDRQLPWKDTNDPYKIWLSEIILQQTRVAQGLPYYLKFVHQYPTVTHLAKASIDEVLKLWQGLGYYSRARNMHHAAKTIVTDYDGVFPSTYKDVIALKGVGKYTAAAIMSFAYGERYPVVDGNVLRVISRLYGIQEAVDHTSTISLIYSLSDKIIKSCDPAEYNQAVMDLGALICKPRNPDCGSCPVSGYCRAHADGLTDSIPYKAKKIKKKTRYMHYLHIVDPSGAVMLRHRGAADIWQGLYDFPLIEEVSSQEVSENNISTLIKELLPMGGEYRLIGSSKLYRHVLTHQNLMVRFYKINVDYFGTVTKPLIKATEDEIDVYGMPVLIANYLQDVKANLF